MIAISRFRVPGDRTVGFVADAEAAVAALRPADGFVGVDLGRNLDEPTLWTIVTRWQNVGSYRRALGSYEAKVTFAPLQPYAIDEPSAYDDPAEVGINTPRDTGAHREFDSGQRGPSL
jgi:heme-degrading monooxygenase HmoA